MACDKAGLYWLPALSSEKFFGRFPACPRGTSATARHTGQFSRLTPRAALVDEALVLVCEYGFMGHGAPADTEGSMAR